MPKRKQQTLWYFGFTKKVQERTRGQDPKLYKCWSWEITEVEKSTRSTEVEKSTRT